MGPNSKDEKELENEEHGGGQGAWWHVCSVLLEDDVLQRRTSGADGSLRTQSLQNFGVYMRSSISLVL